MRVCSGKLFFTLLLLTLLVAGCGRRGDPVAIIPVKEVAVEKIFEDEKTPLTEIKDIGISEKVKTPQPEPPTGLVAVYTKTSVILTWDEIINQDIKGYNIYRSTGDGYTLIGRTITPAFTDRDIKPDIRYLYRVTVIGETESLPSEEIEVVTEFR